MLRREQAPALRCNLIITHIGRGNKSSAEVFVPANSLLRVQRTRGSCLFQITQWEGTHGEPLSTYGRQQEVLVKQQVRTHPNIIILKV